jgi:arylsulfatase A-like enzyme
VTSKLAVQNADRTLRQLLDWLDSRPDVKGNTDVVVTSDHGFATVSRREIDHQGHVTASEAARHDYIDQTGRVEVEKGMLPPGFLAIDLALGLHMDLLDPDRRGPATSVFPFAKVRLEFETWEHPTNGNGLIGREVRRPDGKDARVIVAANGGSDLVYVPDGSPEMVSRVVDLLATYDYVGGIFVDDKFGKLPGTLPLSSINLVGASGLPRPSIAVAFKVFYFNPSDIRTAVQLSDTALQEGQGMHGGFGRDNTFNNMAAIGPDFKAHSVDDSPVSNADIVPTLAHVLGFEFADHKSLSGRVAAESLSLSHDVPVASRAATLSSPPSVDRRHTVLQYQEMNGSRYLQAACFVLEPITECR